MVCRGGNWIHSKNKGENVIMSYTEVIKFDKKGNPSSAGRVKNASRGSWIIWSILSQKYLGRDFSYLDPKLEQETWNLIWDDRLTDTEKIVLGSTYDFVLIKKEYIRKLIDAYEEFAKRDDNLSLNEQNEILKKLENDKDCIAVGFNQNSISCDMCEDYNCITGTKHWYLFD